MKASTITLAVAGILASGCQTLPEGQWSGNDKKASPQQAIQSGALVEAFSLETPDTDQEEDQDQYTEDIAYCELQWMQSRGVNSALDTATALVTAAVNETVAYGIAVFLHWRKRIVFARDAERFLSLCMRSKGYADAEYTFWSQ